MEALKKTSQFVQFDLGFNNLFSWFQGQDKVTGEGIDEAVRSALLGGFKANLAVNYMKSLSSLLPPQLQGAGGFTLNANLKLSYDDVEEILEHPFLGSAKETVEFMNSLDKFKACMDLDLSDGMSSAFGVTKEMALKHMMEEHHEKFLSLNATLALGSEPLGVTFDAVIENVGHLNLTAESLGFVHFKELLIKLLIFKVVDSYDLHEML